MLTPKIANDLQLFNDLAHTRSEELLNFYQNLSVLNVRFDKNVELVSIHFEYTSRGETQRDTEIYNYAEFFTKEAFRNDKINTILDV